MYLTRWKSPPDSTADQEPFRYGLLRSTNAIRIAVIQPGTGRQGISIELIDSFVTGPQRIPYDALSYTWGNSTRDKSISCNNKRLAVTQTLLEALQRFRDSEQPKFLWIDQVCICQERVKERNRQVELMGQIFKGARKVVVYLGEDYDDSRAGMQLARQLLSIARHQPVSGLGEADLETHGLPKQGHRRWLALSGILRRPWFWRTWVVQEVVLNRNVELVLGAAMITWDELERVVSLLEGPIPKVWELDQAMSASELPFSRINRIRLRHQRIIATPITPVQIDGKFETQFHEEPESMMDATQDDDDDDPELLDLLLMSRGLASTDPRDKIYALLGLSVGSHEINPDYSLSPESVFVDFALRTIGVVTSMHTQRRAASLEMSAHSREVRRAMILISCAGRHNQKLQLPSWVPDWTVNLSCRPLVFGMGKRFAAGGDRLGLFDWEPDFGLLLCGKLIDSVAVAGTTHLTHEYGTDNPHTAIADWWQEAQQIALSRIARTPGSTINVDAFAALRRDLSLCKHGYYIPPSQKGRRSSLLDEVDLADDVFHSTSQTLTLGPTRGRVLFASATGYVGLAPHGTREGDLLYVVLGADVPFVLRPVEGEEAFELVGEAYVQGLMRGEAMGDDGVAVTDVMIR